MLVKLYTRHCAVWIDTEQFAYRERVLTIYTARGNRLADTARTKKQRERASYGVHIDNVFASPELAKANADRIYADMERRAKERKLDLQAQ